MDKGLTIANAATTAYDVIESEEVADYFICCICLDLLYKPIVLSCGHISCFWCVHKSMSSLRESHCPICRHPYNYFPTVCEMLHSLLLKMYPVSYKRREEQTLGEEKEMGCFSPQLDNIESKLCKDQEYDLLKDHRCLLTTRLDSDSYSEPCSAGEEEPKGICKRLSITDVQCSACKQLLFRPVFLNCGHGYCQACISSSVDEMLICQVCHSLHPTGFSEVCLELDHFLEEQFPRDYALRRDAVQLTQANVKIENSRGCMAALPSNGSVKAGKNCCPFSSKLKEGKLHFGAGCDFCGMFPIIGDRYRCKDCVEKVGFDLCGDCYNTRSKRPGRFNQQHTPDHKFELVKPVDSPPEFLVLLDGQLGYGAFAIASSDDLSDVPDIESPAEDEAGNPSESQNNQNESQPSS